MITSLGLLFIIFSTPQSEGRQKQEKLSADAVAFLKNYLQKEPIEVCLYTLDRVFEHRDLEDLARAGFFDRVYRLTMSGPSTPAMVMTFYQGERGVWLKRETLNFSLQGVPNSDPAVLRVNSLMKALSPIEVQSFRQNLEGVAIFDMESTKTPISGQHLYRLEIWEEGRFHKVTRSFERDSLEDLGSFAPILLAFGVDS